MIRKRHGDGGNFDPAANKFRRVLEMGQSVVFVPTDSADGLSPQAHLRDRHHSSPQDHGVICADLSDLEDVYYDILVFFSPTGITSLYENFPDFRQNDTRIAAFGPTTAKSVADHELILDIDAPNEKAPSMSMALDQYIKVSNKRKR